MPAVINFAANLALGGGLAWVARRSPAVRRDFVSWALVFLVGFEAVVVTPVSTFLFRFYPQWSMLYAFDPQVFPNLDTWIGPLSLLAVLVNFAAALLGFFITRGGVVRGSRWLCFTPWAAGALIVIACAALYGERLVYIGDYDAFWQGTADLFLLRVGGWVGLALYVCSALFVRWVQRRFHDHDPSLV